MIDIIEAIRSFDDYIGGTGCSEKQIQKAEKRLNLLFAEDYKAYLREIGLAYFYGHELTGIGKIDRLNVVNVTEEQKSFTLEIPDELYVIENLGIDGVVLWQSQDGTIYQSVPGSALQKQFNSLYEYIQSL